MKDDETGGIFAGLPTVTLTEVSPCFRPGTEYIFMSTSTSTLVIDEYEYIAKS